jgi:hypothetical protein
MKRRLLVTLAIGAAAVLTTALAAQAGSVGPVKPYLSSADSPFNPASFTYFHLETFEDGALNTPGVTANTGFPTGQGFGGTIIDSVKGDGNCPQASAPNPCNSYFASGNPGIVFTFNAGTLGSLPTAVGIVWTDGGFSADATLEAFGLGMVSLGSITAADIGDGTNFGTTDEDTFLGWTDLNGILAISIRDNGGGGIEVDHLQYGGGERTIPGPSVPAPPTLLLVGLAVAGIAAAGRRRR